MSEKDEKDQNSERAKVLLPTPRTESQNGSTEPPSPPDESPTKKRKRSAVKTEEELEIDLSLPEPPSKKSLRKSKKLKSTPSKPSNSTATKSASSIDHENDEPLESKATQPSKRSEHGIWIGNLPYIATRLTLRSFLTTSASIPESAITRIHIPAPAPGAPGMERKHHKPQNKGFAYVDVDCKETLEKCLALSETLFDGRRVLIKNSGSFEGRPLKQETPKSIDAAKAPSRRIFVGNLGFDISKEELQEHFKPCGEVVDVHMATFEDTGKCKGFAWVTFEEIEAGEAAVRGWTKIPIQQYDEESTEEAGDQSSDTENNRKAAEKKGKKQSKRKERKWFVNKLHGRPLRCEFAEDAATRYKKRFGKDGSSKNGTRPGTNGTVNDENITEVDGPARPQRKPSKSDREDRKMDARNIRPGAALANAQRSSYAIVASTGTKVKFD